VALTSKSAALLVLTTLAFAACGTEDPQSTPNDPSAEAGAGGGSATGGDGGDGPIEIHEGECSIDADAEAPDSAPELNCKADFDALASAPLDASLPGATSAKVVLDQYDENALYFQNSTRFPIHYDFVSTHLSGGELPIVPELSLFESTEYYTPDRRFILGAVSYYEAPDVWALELSPYDTASAEMMQTLYEAVAAHSYFGPALKFHPTSEAIESVANKLPASVKIITTDELYQQIDYQPLTLGSTIGRIHFAPPSSTTSTSSTKTSRCSIRRPTTSRSWPA
jgi:hypothetical protein